MPWARGALVLGVSLLFLACDRGPATVEIRGTTMGTSYTVKVVAPTDEDGTDGLGALVQSTLDEVDATMSTWKDESEVSRLNRWGEPDPFPVSEGTLAVLRVAAEVSRRSEGAFDVTVSPLVDLWGFGPAGRPSTPPKEATIAAALDRVGFERIELGDGVVVKSRPDLVIDLSAIAKGFGVDRVAETLLAAGYDRFMVEVGGEVRTAGASSSNGPWRIAVERPVDGYGPRELHRVVELSGLALATSGDYRNYYEEGGRRISHTIDPRTGRPIAHRLASVSVIGEECVWADAWATALDVLGPQGPALAAAEDLPALFLFRDDGGFREEVTPAFERLVPGSR